MKKSRLDYSIINSFIGSLSQVATLVIGFITQTIFIKTLGATYLGVKGLFSNILSVLSFTELGIGTAITYSLYKPLANNNNNQVSLIMRFFRKAYNIIGIIVGVLGVCLIPFIHFFTHQKINFLYVYYLLFLANTVVSYFYTYKRTLLNADQLSYINLLNQIIFKIIQAILQIIVLIIFKSFFWFLVIQLLCTIFSNIIISIQVDRRYPYLNQISKKDKLSHKILHEIFHNTVGLVGTKISSVLVMGSDNALISYFTSLYQAGIYSNYMFIINGVTSVFSQATNALAASIGNLNAEGNDIEKQYDIFNKCFFLVQACTFFCASCLLVLIDSFIDIWVGKKYEFAFLVTFLLVFNFIIMGLRQAFFPFVSAYGLYSKDGVKAFIESIINLILSIIYAKYLKLGVAAIILGTISSNILVNWYEPYMILKYGIKQNKKYFQVYLKYLYYIIVDTIVMLLLHCLLHWYKVTGIFSFIELTGITIIVTIIIYLLLFSWSKYFKFLIFMVKKFLKR